MTDNVVQYPKMSDNVGQSDMSDIIGKSLSLINIYTQLQYPVYIHFRYMV